MQWVLQICFLFFLAIMHLTTAQDHEYCYNTGNFTTNGRYANNRNFILSNLASNVSANGGFYTATVGQDPNKVHTLAVCRGDSSPETCTLCISSAIQALKSKCPNQTDSISWGADPPCIVRVANRSFYGILELDPMNAGYNTGRITTNLTEFDQIWENLMDRTVVKASSGSSTLKYATEEANLTPFQSIYALMQCTPDMSKSNCDTCLRQSVAYFQNCCPGNQGGYVQRPNCIFRWDLYPFYDDTADAPTANSPPPLTNATGTKGTSGTSSSTIIAIVAPIAVTTVLLVVCICLLRRRAKKKYNSVPDENADDITTLESLQFDFETIEVATNKFSTDNKLGEGGFGEVYKGVLPSTEEIAVKRLSRTSGQGVQEFKNEVMLVAKLQHRNLVRLLGFCIEGEEKILVYEFVPNKSLDYFLDDPEKQGLLDWSRRYKIIGQIAKGILYLHEDSRLRIIHRDLKASNILLDADMNPKISDFGMARLFGVDQTQGNTSRIVGTYGYMSPEYAMHGHFSVKSDVYSFGVLILEIITGKKNSSFYQTDGATDLPSYAWKHWRDGTHLQLLDSNLTDSYSRNEVIRCIHLGLLCLQEDPDRRPSMATIVLTLNSYSVTLPLPQQPAFFLGSRTEESLRAKEFECSDKTTNKSIPWSVDEASITEVCPR